MPIKKYKRVQAGPNSQLGGAKKGFSRVAYQVGIAAAVKGVPSRPTSSQAIIEVRNLPNLFINLLCSLIDKSQSNAAFIGSTSAADAVNIVSVSFWQIVINDVRDVINI